MRNNDQYLAATQGAALFDLSNRGKIELTGADRVRLLNNLCTNDVTNLAAGAGCEAFVLNVKGRIEDYVRIFAKPESLMIDCDPGRNESLIPFLDRYVIREDVQLHDHTRELSLLHVSGAKAVEVLRSLDGAVNDLENLQHQQCTLAGVICDLRRCDRSVQGGFDVLIPHDHCPGVQEALIGAGARCVDGDLIELLRVEAGLPKMGVDVSDENLVQEVDRNEQAVCLTKGCYLGQETVARLDAMGHVNKLLRGLILDADGEVPAGGAVVNGDKQVGVLTSCVASPSLNTPIGLAVVRAASAQPGTSLSVQTADGLVSATVSDLPFSSS